LKQYLGYSLLEKAIHQQILKDPNNMALHQSLAMVYQEMGNNEKAIQAYEGSLELDPNQAVSLNNLAWLLVTAPEKRLRNEARGLELAKEAVALKRSPVFLDTLAEAYYVNGFRDKAVKTIEEAIALAKQNRGYYEKQLEKFLAPRQ
jgi:Tfp pilus assembly protein PilF